MFSQKPYTAVTVYVDRLTGEEYEENDVGGIPDLIEITRIQETGPAEAARAIRKKLKYGSTHRQLRALTILDGLVQNTDDRFHRKLLDEPLMERLRLIPKDVLVDASVKNKYDTLVRQWTSSKNKPGLAPLAVLAKQLPRKARPAASQSKVLQETERQAQEDVNPFLSEEEEPPSPVNEPSTSRFPDQGRRKSSVSRPSLSNTASSSPGAVPSSKDHSHSASKSKKKSKSTKKRILFDLSKEKPQIMQAIGQSSIASTNLINSLKFVNREAGELPSTTREVVVRFEQCKSLRRKILRYIQLVESDEWIGGLLTANDELVKSLMAWEVIEKGVDEDSDSEVEDALENIRREGVKGAGFAPSGQSISHGHGGHGKARASISGINQQFGDLTVAPKQPPRPPPATTTGRASEDDEDESEPDEDDEEDNPFGNHAAIR